tara:strand:- start:97 stop:681 length:585 start_codon:yes stop_codon:yes gene_type:complete
MKNIYKNQIEQHLTNRMTVEEFIQLVNGSAKFDTKLLDKLIKEDDANYKKNQPIASMQFKKTRSFKTIKKLINDILNGAGKKTSNCQSIADVLEYFRKENFQSELTNEIWRTLFLPSLETYITDCLNQSKVNITFKGIESHMMHDYFNFYIKDVDLSKKYTNTNFARSSFKKQLISLIENNKLESSIEEIKECA